MNRHQLKVQARNRIAHATPKPLKVGAVFTVIIILLAFFSFKLTQEEGYKVYMEHINPQEMQSMSLEEYLKAFDYNSLAKDLMKATPTGLASLLGDALTMLNMIVTAGMLIFCLNTLRGSGEASCWNLYDGFSFFWRIILLYLLELVFISLWAMLFVIPGIIAFYRYRQAIYLLIDHPEMSLMQCLRKSSELMYGHKWELFFLDLSFIGWFILIILGNSFGLSIGIPVIGYLVGFYFFPYYYLTCAGFYRTLTNDDLPNSDGWVPEV